jgi:hypothetical protein
MCMDPVSMTLIASTGLAAAQAGGTIMSGYQQLQTGQYERDLAYRNAQQSELSADYNEALKRNESERDIAKQTVALAGQGNRIDTGTPLLLLAQSARNAELDALAIRTEGVARGQSYKAQGDQALAEGKNAYSSSFFTAAGQLLGFANSPLGQKGLAALGAI